MELKCDESLSNVAFNFNLRRYTAARHSTAAARRTCVTTCLLLFILSGPLRSLNYLFLHGMMGLTLGALWNKGCTWWITIPAAAAVRCAGIFASLAVSSAILRENVMALLVTQMYGLLDQIAANIGGVNGNRCHLTACS